MSLIGFARQWRRERTRRRTLRAMRKRRVRVVMDFAEHTKAPSEDGALG